MAKAIADIWWKRGDTYPFNITIKADGLPVDLTGYLSVDLCINSSNTPIDSTTELTTVIGVFDNDRTSGKVTFQFTDEQADNIGKYYYDIQSVDSTGARRTYKLSSNKFTFTQDINKD